MRFDDTLETVLAGDLSSPSGLQSVWRQLVDLIGRRRVTADVRAIAMLRRIRDEIPPPVRVSTARALEFADPPPPLVRLFAVDILPVAMPVLRSARMTSAEWVQLLPELAPPSRAVLRNRRDLSPVVRRALESYGPIDFVLPDESRPEPAIETAAETEEIAAVPDTIEPAEMGPEPEPEALPEPIAHEPVAAIAEEAELLAVEPIPEPVEAEPAPEAMDSAPESAAVPLRLPPEPAPPAIPDRIVDWTEILALPDPRPAPMPEPEIAESAPQPAAEAAPEPEEAAVPEPAPIAQVMEIEEDYSFVALAGLAAAVPNDTKVTLAQPEIPPIRDQSGTVGASVPERSIAEPEAPPQGPAVIAGDHEVLDEAQAPDPVEAANDAQEEDAGPFEIAEVVARIDAFWRSRDEGGGETVPRAARPGDHFRFETDAKGVIRWVDGVTRAPIVGLALDAQGALGGLEASRVDGVAAGAFRRRAGFSNARMMVEGDSDAAGDWLISAIPVFDPANGRFTGYRGTARRPRSDERAEPVREAPAASTPADSLRQLVHELRTPTNAIAGFAEMIETQMLGPVSEPYRDRAHVIRAQAKELLGAIDDLDLAARIDSAALALVPGRVPLRPLLAGIADDLGQLAALRGSVIQLPIDDLAVTGDRRAVERLLSRLMATLVSASGGGERIGVHTALESENLVAITIDRPKALNDYPGDSVLGIDDEREDSTLLGTGFALRLARNLARELGGSLVIEPETLTLRLPASVTSAVGQAHLS